MGVNNYLEFGNVLKQRDKIKIEKDTEFGGINSEKIFDILSSNFEKSHIFEIDDSIKNLLFLTKTPKENKGINLPFDIVFLDFSITKEEMIKMNIKSKYNSIKGMFAFVNKEQKGDVTLTSIEIAYLIEEEDKIGIDFGMVDYNVDGKAKIDINEDETGSCEKTRSFMENLFLNFLNFLNNPEIRFIEHKRSDKNIQRRIKNNQTPINISYEIELFGELKRYIDKINSGISFTYSYKFWVRGHFKRQHYKKETKVIWIYPYVKGEGILITKRYKLEKRGGKR